MLRGERKIQLKEQIFVQAMKLFKEKGFDQVTVEEITTACGVAKGTFYNYFPKKEAVLLHLSETQMESVRTSSLNHTNVKDPKERLTLLFRDLFARYAAHPDMIRLMVSEMVRSPQLMKEEMKASQQFQELLVIQLHELQQIGQLAKHLVCSDIADLLVGIYFHTLMIWASSEPNTLDIESLFLRHFDIIWEGIRTREAAASHHTTPVVENG
jgi:AcrR family transcriptional regulator